MTTGTPLDLTPFGSVLVGIGIFYWLLAALGLWWALRGKSSRKVKLLKVAAVLLVFGFLPGRDAWLAYQYQQRLKAATDHFEMRCKSAGEKITRTVENVDGVVWMKWREKGTNYSDQFKLDDPYGKDCEGEGCIENIMRATGGLHLVYFDSEDRLHHRQGYRFVESVDPSDGQLYRYTRQLYRPFERDPKWLESLVRTELLKTPIEKHSARYGIAWDDISTRKDREHWIAGSSLKVIDLQTNEVIAERVGYMFDQGLGSQAGFRSPWLFAQQFACPEFPQVAPADSRRRRTYQENREFILKIIQPSSEGNK